MKKLNTTLLLRINNIHRSIEDVGINFRKTHNLNFNQVAILCLLADGKRLFIQEISRSLKLVSSAGSKEVCILEAKGLIQRELSEKNKRNMYFTITEAGLASLDAIQDYEIEGLIKLIVKQ